MNDDSSRPGDVQPAWGEATDLVRAGLARSQFGETSEAIFLNSGFVYKSAEEAEARFKGEQEGFVYSRYGNPTVRMFEQRLRARRTVSPRPVEWRRFGPRCFASSRRGTMWLPRGRFSVPAISS